MNRFHDWNVAFPRTRIGYDGLSKREMSSALDNYIYHTSDHLNTVMATEVSVIPPHLSFLNPYIMDGLIRFGKRGDGGYVLPSSVVREADALLSFGIGWDWSMEKSVVGISGLNHLTIHAYDHTVGSEAYLLNFCKGMIGFLVGRVSYSGLSTRLRTYLDYRGFFSGKHVHFRERVWNYTCNRNDVMIETVFHRLPNARHLLLKMDIDGAEYRVIPDILKYSSQIDLMMIEFHGTWHLRSIFEMHVRNILDYFNIVHVHGNNFGGIAADGLPDALEITFVNKRFPTTGTFRNHLPVAGLDFPNDPSRPDIVLHFR